MRQAADVGDTLVELGLQGGQQVGGRRRVAREEVARPLEAEAQAGERGSEAVVDLPADDATLLEPGPGEPVAGVLDLLGGPGHRDGRRDDRREVGEGLPAAGTEGLAAGQGHDEVADVLAAVTERDLDRVAVRHAPPDRVAPRHVDGHGLQAHGGADVAGEAAQQVVGGPASRRWLPRVRTTCSGDAATP